MPEGPLNGGESEPKSVNLEDDHRPELSPYASAIWSLYFQNSGPLNVPSQFLSQSPTLALLTQSTPELGVPSHTLHFDDISPDTGHTLAHFLHTGSYECLKPKGESHAERTAAEIATACRVYTAAESWKLSSLCDLAAKEMMRLGDQLSLLSIIDTLEQANSTAISLPIVTTYFTSRITSVCEDSATADQILVEIGTPNTISKLILKCLVELSGRSLSWKKPAPPNGVSAKDEDQAGECSSADYSSKKPDMPLEDPDLESVLEEGNIEGSISQSEEYTLEPGEKTPVSEHIVLQDKQGEESPPEIKKEPPGGLLEVRDTGEYRRLAQLSSSSRVIEEVDTPAAKEATAADPDHPAPIKPMSPKEKKKGKKVKKKKEANDL